MRRPSGHVLAAATRACVSVSSARRASCSTRAATRRSTTAPSPPGPPSTPRRSTAAGPSRSALAADAYLETTSTTGTVPDTGSLRGDLRAIVDGAADLLADPAVRRSFAALVVAIQAEPELASSTRERWLDEREFLAVAVRRAAERGEVAPLRATAETVELLLSPRSSCGR